MKHILRKSIINDRLYFNGAKILVIAILLLSSCKSGTNMERQNNRNKLPNIVLINSDDVGYGDLGCYGATKVQTPNIDGLAKQGIMFTDAHAASSVCSPSRYGLLTGCYPLRRNFWGPIPNTALSIDTNHLTISRLLKEAGYNTACIGKWHLGFGDDEKTDYNKALNPGPLELGFDYYFGIPLVNSQPPFVYVENHMVVGHDPDDPFIFGEASVTQQFPEKNWQGKFGGAREAHTIYRDEQVGTTLTNKAIEWMRKVHGDKIGKPFFLYFATTNIHHPFTPAPQFKGTSVCGRYGDFIHELDWIVGKVLSALDDMGVSENTLVIFTSDNGGCLNLGGQDAWKTGHRLNGDLLGFKFGAWEGGHRIPFIARWPGKILPNKISDQLISHVDLLATFANIVGKSLDKEEKFDSVDQLEALTGNPESMIRDHLIISPNWPSHLVVRKGDWVYIDAQNEGGFSGTEVGDMHLGGAAALKFTAQENSDVGEGKIRKDAPPAQLYNLSNDLSQTKNVYRENPEVVKELQGLLSNYREKVGAFPELGWIDNR